MASSFQFSIIYVIKVMFHFGVFFTFVYFMLSSFYLSGHDKFILVVITKRSGYYL